jgi:plastocyanin
LGNAYNPPDPGQPANSFYVDAYELRPNLIFVKAGTWVTWWNQDNKPLFVTSEDALFFGITSPFGHPWSYLFDSPGVFAFSISPYNATEIGVVVVTQ